MVTFSITSDQVLPIAATWLAVSSHRTIAIKHWTHSAAGNE